MVTHESVESVDGRIDFERASLTLSDLELETVTSEDEDYTSAPADYEILTYPADFTLEVLYQKWQNREINVPEEFQRAFVWKPVQSSKLIESFLHGLPVPPVYFFTERHTQNYLVVDGQQRLKSIFHYLDGHFAEDAKGNTRVFRLTGLNENSRFKEKAFVDLSDEDQKKLKGAVLRAFIVHQLVPDDDISVYHIFERLNTGGTLLTNQEIRNCVCHGKFVEHLKKLNGDPEWRRILGKQVEDSRKRDIELMVRFFAMRDIHGYQKPMKDYLSKFMWKNRDISDKVIDESERTFRSTCVELINALGEKPFHRGAGLNAAVMDAVMVAFSNNLPVIPADIGSRYEALKSDGDFQESVNRGTTYVSVVRTRFSRAEKILFG